MWTLTEYFIMGENLLKEIEKGSKMAVMKKKITRGGRGRPRSDQCLPIEKQPFGTAGRGSSDRKRGGISVFTGIVEEVGAIKNIKRGQHSAVLTIHAKTVLEETRIGDSVRRTGKNG